MVRIKEGYKGTEIGIIPEEWEVIRIDDCASRIYGGGTPSRNNAKYYNGNIPWITVKDLDGSFYKDDAIEYITEEAIKYSATNLIQENSVIIATRMGLGRGFINTKPVAINQDMKALILNDNIDSRYFLFWYINKASMIEKLGTGTTVKGIRLETLRELKLPLPPFREQQRIVEVLSVTDNHIEKLDKTIEDYILLKKGMMKKLFSEGIGHAEFKATDIGVIPMRWELIPTEDMLISEKGAMKIGPFGSQLKKEYLVGSGYKVYGQENVFYNDFSIGSRFLSEVRYEQLKSCELLPGDLVITMMGTIGKAAIVPSDIEQGIMDSHLIRLRVDESRFCNEFILHFLASNMIKKQIEKLSVGGIMAGLSSAIIKKLRFVVPPLPEQQQISKVLSELDNRIDLYIQNRETYLQLKKALTEQLLKGKVRVPLS